MKKTFYIILLITSLIIFSSCNLSKPDDIIIEKIEDENNSIKVHVILNDAIKTYLEVLNPYQTKISGKEVYEIVDQIDNSKKAMLEVNNLSAGTLYKIRVRNENNIINERYRKTKDYNIKENNLPVLISKELTKKSLFVKTEDVSGIKSVTLIIQQKNDPLSEKKEYQLLSNLNKEYKYDVNLKADFIYKLIIEDNQENKYIENGEL